MEQTLPQIKTKAKDKESGLNTHETKLLSNLVKKTDTKVSLDDVGGLDDVKVLDNPLQS